MLLFDTIKLNKEYWIKKIPGLRWGVPNPLNVFSTDQKKYTEALTTFNFSGVFKTTQAGRHEQTQRYLKGKIDHFTDPPSILDIGASDGSTSLDLINLVKGAFKKYYITDYNIKCSYLHDKGYTFFFKMEEECFLVATKKFVFFPANRRLFNTLFKRKLERIKDLAKTELLFINKDLQELQKTDIRIEIMRYNIFEPWIKEKVNIVIVGNLLNRAYFTDAQIETGIRNCVNTLAENGLLAIIRNVASKNGTEIEKSAIYQKNTKAGSLQKIREINTGIEIDDLLLSLRY